MESRWKIAILAIWRAPRRQIGDLAGAAVSICGSIAISTLIVIPVRSRMLLVASHGILERRRRGKYSEWSEFFKMRINFHLLSLLKEATLQDGWIGGKFHHCNSQFLSSNPSNRSNMSLKASVGSMWKCIEVIFIILMFSRQKLISLIELIDLNALWLHSWVQKWRFNQQRVP